MRTWDAKVSHAATLTGWGLLVMVVLIGGAAVAGFLGFDISWLLFVVAGLAIPFYLGAIAPKHCELQLDGDELRLVRNNRVRRRVSLAGASMTYAKMGHRSVGVSGTIALIESNGSRWRLGGRDFLFDDARRYTLPLSVACDAYVEKGAFAEIIASIDPTSEIAVAPGGAPAMLTLRAPLDSAGAGEPVRPATQRWVFDLISAPGRGAGLYILLFWVVLAGVTTLGYAVLPDLDAHPQQAVMLSGVGMGLAVLAIALLAVSRRGPWQIEVTVDHVTLSRRRRVIAEAATQSLSLTPGIYRFSGRHIGRAAYPTLLIGFPSGKRLRVGVYDLRMAWHGDVRKSGPPRLLLGPAEWEPLMVCLGLDQLLHKDQSREDAYYRQLG